jgi:hypothetical protein
MTHYHKIDLRRGGNDWAREFQAECVRWNNRHLYVLEGEQVADVPLVLPAEYLDQYRRNYMSYLSGDYFLNDPRPQPYFQPHDTTAQSSSQQQPSPQQYSEQQQPHTPFPDLSLYTQHQHYANIPDQPSYTPQQQDTSFPQPPPYTQSYNDSDYLISFPQTRNLLDQMNFESPGTQHFNENYAGFYNTTPNQLTQPQPTQEISQDLMWIQETNEYVNSSWAAGGQSSTPAHGGEGSSSAAVQNNPPTQVFDFWALTQEGDQQGHRQGYPPQCDTGSHRVRDDDQH